MRSCAVSVIVLFTTGFLKAGDSLPTDELKKDELEKAAALVEMVDLIQVVGETTFDRDLNFFNKTDSAEASLLKLHKRGDASNIRAWEAWRQLRLKSTKNQYTQRWLALLQDSGCSNSADLAKLIDAGW